MKDLTQCLLPKDKKEAIIQMIKEATELDQKENTQHAKEMGSVVEKYLKQRNWKCVENCANLTILNTIFSELVELYNKAFATNLEINEHCRPIPLSEKFMKKKIDDLIYAYFQCESYKGDDENGNEVYFVYKTPTTISECAKATKTNRRTCDRHIDILVKEGYLALGKVANVQGELVDAYILTLYDQYFQKIRIDTLQYLIQTTNQDIIKTYAYLLDKYLWKKEQGEQYLFSLKELIINVLGINSTTNQRDYILMNNLLDLLQKIKLLKVADKKKMVEVNGQTTSYYVIEDMSLTVENLFKKIK